MAGTLLFSCVKVFLVIELESALLKDCLLFYSVLSCGLRVTSPKYRNHA